MIPRFDSVWPMRAVSFRMRIWQAIEISQPPPSAWPLMAAMTGFGKRSMRRKTELLKRMKEATSDPENTEPRSAPAQKILSPAPVMIRHLTAAFDSSSDSTAFTAFINPSLMAFAGGRLRVTTAKASSRLRIRVSYGIDDLLAHPAGLASMSSWPRSIQVDGAHGSLRGLSASIPSPLTMACRGGKITAGGSHDLLELSAREPCRGKVLRSVRGAIVGAVSRLRHHESPAVE